MYWTLGAVDYTALNFPNLENVVSSGPSTTYAGFPTSAIAAFLGFSYPYALVAQKAYNGEPMTEAETELWNRVLKMPATMANIRTGFDHLARHPAGSKAHHGPMKALRRAVHFTPRSFQLKNIMGAMGSVMVGWYTAGLGQMIAPKVFSADSAAMKNLGIAYTAIGLSAGAVVLGPGIAASLGPTLSSAASMSGQAVSTFGTFYKAYNMLKPAQQKELASSLTPQQVLDIDQGRTPIESLLAENRVIPVSAPSILPELPPPTMTVPSRPAVSPLPLAIGLLIGVPFAIILARRITR